MRSLKDLGRLGKERVGIVYDVLYRAMCAVGDSGAAGGGQAAGGEKEGVLVNTGLVGEGEEKLETRVGLKTFQYFLSDVATWARNEKIVMNGFQVGVPFLPVLERAIDRLL